MRGGHGRKRARTADREQMVEAINLAYVDGQIDAEDRDERVARALTSTNLEGLRPLVADLQVPRHLRLPEPVVPRSASPAPTASQKGRPRSWAESRQRLRQASRWEKGVLAAAVVGGPLVLILAVGADSEEPADLDLHSAAGIEQLVSDVEEEFGTTEVLELEINDTWARVYVHEEGARFRYYTYGRPLEPSSSAADFFDEGQGGTTQDADPDLIDLAELDADQLVANIELARQRLGLDEGATEVMVTVADERMATDFATQEPFASDEQDAPAHVQIELSNEYLESASLTTDLSGDEILLERKATTPEATG